jgi:hypothetical protein
VKMGYFVHEECELCVARTVRAACARDVCACARAIVRCSWVDQPNQQRQSLEVVCCQSVSDAGGLLNGRKSPWQEPARTCAQPARCFSGSRRGSEYTGQGLTTRPARTCAMFGTLSTCAQARTRTRTRARGMAQWRPARRFAQARRYAPTCGQSSSLATSSPCWPSVAICVAMATSTRQSARARHVATGRPGRVPKWHIQTPR